MEWTDVILKWFGISVMVMFALIGICWLLCAIKITCMCCKCKDKKDV
jgi:hypothetical protein